MKTVLKLEGLDCAVCARELEELIKEIDGVEYAFVAFAAGMLTVECDGEETLTRVKETANSFEEVRVVEEKAEGGETVLQIENLHCANCALELESELKKLKGVQSARVDFIAQKIFLVADEEGVARAVKCANRFEKVKVVDGEKYLKKKPSRLKEWLRIALSALFLGLGVLFVSLEKGLPLTVLGYCCYAFAYFAVGYDVLISTFKNVLKGRIFDENFLMTVASIGAVALGEALEGVAVMLLYQLGELLQSIAVGSSRNSVAKLMDLKTTFASRLNEKGEYETVKPEELKLGDIVLVKAGEKVPCDGILIEEFAVLDTKSLTGEAEPKTVKKGEEVLSGFINVGGVFSLRITREYEDSAVKKILDLMENSAAKKASPEKFITKFARYYTPAVCIFALLFALVPPVISYFAVGNANLVRYLRSALTFLVISCPCALIISVPLTYFSGLGACAKRGILVKGATYLDEAAAVKTIAFDKTGTLTEGDFEIRGVVAGKAEKEELFALAAALERNSAHPLAKAFSDVETDKKALSAVETMGKGVCGEINGNTVLIGSLSYLQEKGVTVEEISSVFTVLYIAREGEYLGAILVGDRIRNDCKEAIERLKAMGYARTVMLTGDTALRAAAVANELGIQEVKAGLLPDEKLRIAEELKKDGKLLYIGDGINDAPVMAVADCSVSMGKLGSAAAVEASDLVLVSDNLSALPSLFKISKKTKRIVKQNIVFSIVMKLAFMLLGAFGVLQLWLAVFADVGVMLLAVLNSLRSRTNA